MELGTSSKYLTRPLPTSIDTIYTLHTQFLPTYYSNLNAYTSHIMYIYKLLMYIFS